MLLENVIYIFLFVVRPGKMMCKADMWTYGPIGPSEGEKSIVEPLVMQILFHRRLLEKQFPSE